MPTQSQPVLDNPLKTPLSNEDLLTTTAEVLNSKKLSIYLLGGNEGVIWQAAQKLKQNFPYLKVVGSALPMILTKGQRLEESQERDNYIVEEINKARPDVLVLQLGHPKQEIWLDRIRHILKVPLVIGVGAAFERYVGRTVIPEWVEKWRMQKLYTQILKPTWNALKHSKDILKYTAWMTPLFCATMPSTNSPPQFSHAIKNRNGATFSFPPIKASR